MTVIQVDLSEGGWQAVPVALARDETLTLRAKMFAVLLVMKPHGWKVIAAAVPRFLSSTNETIGRDLARRLIRELEVAGYLHRQRTRDSSGRWTWTTVFKPVPSKSRVHGGRTMPAFAGHGAAADGHAGDGEGGDLQQTLTKPRPEEEQTTTTEQVVVVGLDDPPLAQYRKSILRSLSLCPAELRQAVVDETTGIALAGRLRTNPGSLARRLSQAAAEGTFEAAAGVAVTAARDRARAERERKALEEEDRRRRSTPEARAKSKAAAADALARMAALRGRPTSVASSSVAAASRPADGGDR